MFPSHWAGTWGSVGWAVNWNVDVAEWRSHEDTENRKTLWDVGFTPSLRVRGDTTPIGRPFADLGLGIHVLEDDHIGTKQLGLSWLFGEFGGVGLQFGAHDEFGVSVRVMHESNGSIREPNNGLTAYMLRLEYAFE